MFKNNIYRKSSKDELKEVSEYRQDLIFRILYCDIEELIYFVSKHPFIWLKHDEAGPIYVAHLLWTRLLAGKLRNNVDLPNTICY